MDEDRARTLEALREFGGSFRVSEHSDTLVSLRPGACRAEITAVLSQILFLPPSRGLRVA